MVQNTNSVIIVAAGSGARMGYKTPKQFLTLKNKVILMRTIEKFSSLTAINEIVVVLSHAERGRWQNLCRKHNFTTTHTIVDGGSSRTESVRNGLKAVQQDGGVVLIHDGARPFVSHEVITRAIEAAKEHKAAVPYIEISDSLRFMDRENGRSVAVDRSVYKSIQTPQSFNKELIIEAYNNIADNTFSDDASLVESFGQEIKLFLGDKNNIKITTSEDLAIARYILSLKR